MRKALASAILCCGAATVPAVGTADESPATPAKPTAARTPGIETGEMRDRLPPGFKVKERGKYVVYCKSETPIGTRFKTETCLDDAQMRDYLIWLQENKADVDRIRATCATKVACGQPGGG